MAYNTEETYLALGATTWLRFVGALTPTTSNHKSGKTIIHVGRKSALKSQDLDKEYELVAGGYYESCDFKFRWRVKNVRSTQKSL